MKLLTFICVPLLFVLTGCSANDPVREDFFTTNIYNSENVTTENLIVGDFVVREDGTIKPAHIANAVAPNDSIYYSTDNNTLVYKDVGGAINILY